MARVVDESVWSNRNISERIRGYLDGQTWRLMPGEDFDGPANRHISHIRAVATRQGVKVHVHKDKDGSLLVRADKPKRKAKSK